MKKVTVVILNFKVKDQTLKCIESIKSSSYHNVEIIVVDNNSQDGIDEVLFDSKDVVFIQTGENLGYTGGNNIGIKHALKEGTDFVFVLNADTVIDKDAIKNLVDSVNQDEIGIVGPKILFDDKKTLWFAGGTFDQANVLGGNRGVNEIDKGQYDQIEETEYITGGAMFVKKEVFEKIGFFDEKYFLYYEDDDFCFRAKQAGYKIKYIPSAIVYHKNAQSTGLGSSLQEYFIIRNRMLLASKFLPFRTKFALFREALRNILNPVRRLAFFDFLTGNFGKGSFLK